MKESLVAKNVKNIIKRKGITQRYLAQKMNIGEKKLSNMLNNRKVITDNDIILFINALAVKPNALFATEEEMKKSS